MGTVILSYFTTGIWSIDWYVYLVLAFNVIPAIIECFVIANILVLKRMQY